MIIASAFIVIKWYIEVWKSFAQSEVFLFSQDNSDKELRTLAPPQVCSGIAADMMFKNEWDVLSQQNTLKWVQSIL